MSREILFKAKRKNWSELPKEEWWVEGNLITNERQEGTAYIGYIFDVHNGMIEDFDIVEVDPKTLCQFTGLYDKNGERIWENDIVQTPFRRFVVTYSDGVWGDISGTAMRESIFGEGGTVIGNIFDRPQLLKGETE